VLHRRAEARRRALAVVPVPRFPRARFAETRVVERCELDISTTGAGVMSWTVSQAPAFLMAAGRFAAFQALFNEWKFTRVDYKFTPAYSGTVGGQVCFYIDRDIAEAIDASVSAAKIRPESSSGTIDKVHRISWVPREPLDHEFQALNPGNQPTATLNRLGELLTANAVQIPNATKIFYLTVTLHMIVRGT